MASDNLLKGEATPNYEEEYQRLCKENSLLQKENADLKETVIRMCKWLFTKGVNHL